MAHWTAGFLAPGEVELVRGRARESFLSGSVGTILERAAERIREKPPVAATAAWRTASALAEALEALNGSLALRLRAQAAPEPDVAGPDGSCGAAVPEDTDGHGDADGSDDPGGPAVFGESDGLWLHDDQDVLDARDAWDAWADGLEGGAL
jgi:hypothetical protein